jgi:DNA polymerase-1
MIDQANNIAFNHQRIAIIDGYGFVFRAFHSLPPLTRNDGTPVGAVYGFTNMIIKLLASLDVTHIVIVFDSGSKNFRNEIYPAYKANRPPCPPDLIPQFSIIREVAESLHLPILEKVGYEADDLIATLTKQSYEQGFDVLIVSSDKDLMQLVNERVHMYDAMRGRIIGVAEVTEKFSVGPKKVLDILSLMGDSSDNIPGVKGIGPKTAAELINEFGSFDKLFENLELVKPARRQELLRQNIENAKMSKILVSLKEEVPLGIEISDLALKAISPEKLISFLEKQGFYSLVSRVKKEFQSQNKAASKIEPKLKQDDEIIVRKVFSDKSGNITIFEEIKQIAIDSKKVTQELLKNCLNNGLAVIDFKFNQNQELEFITISTCKQNCSLIEVFYLKFEKEAKLDAKNSKLSPVTQDLFDFTEEEEIFQAPLMQYKNNEIIVDFLENFLIFIAQNPAINKIFFDAKTIIKFLQKSSNNLEAFEDLSLINHLLNSSVKNDLRELININLIEDIESNGLGEIFKKLLAKDSNQVFLEIEDGKNKEAEFYCFRNYAIFQLYKVLKPRIFTQQLNQAYYNYEKPLLAILAEMEADGVSVDVIRLKELSQEFEIEIKKLTKEIYNLAGSEFNIASPQQLSEVLFKQLGLSSSKKLKKTGALSTSSKVLEELLSEGHIIAQKILDFRHFSKLKNTYTDSLPTQINPITNRIHSHFSTISTLTGRLSSSNPNLQNIPIKTIYGQKIRECFIAKKDHLLISADYSQIELRVLAHMAKIESLVVAFKTGKDIHKITASQIFKVDEDKVDNNLRSKAKAINFGIIYGISAFGLAKQLEISNFEAANYIKFYLQAYPGIEAYMQNYIKIAEKHGFVTTIGGRKCFISAINSKNPVLRQMSQRQAINAPIQGSAADIIKKAMIELHQKLADQFPAAKITLQIHDELIIEAPENEAEKVAKIVKATMENTLILDVALKVDIDIGKRWL